MANQPKLILAEDDEDDQKDFKINFHKDRRTLAQLNQNFPSGNDKANTDHESRERKKNCFNTRGLKLIC